VPLGTFSNPPKVLGFTGWKPISWHLFIQACESHCQFDPGSGPRSLSPFTPFTPWSRICPSIFLQRKRGEAKHQIEVFMTAKWKLPNTSWIRLIRCAPLWSFRTLLESRTFVLIGQFQKKLNDEDRYCNGSKLSPPIIGWFTKDTEAFRSVSPRCWSSRSHTWCSFRMVSRILHSTTRTAARDISALGWKSP
jgi:hypothetical protein